MKYTIAVTSYGFITIEADNEDEAIEIAMELATDDFEWTDFGEAEVIARKEN